VHKKRLPDVRGCRDAWQQDSEQGSAVRRRIPEYLTIATVLRPRGIRGELKVRIETNFPGRFARLTRVYLGPEYRPFDFESFRPHKGHGLLKLKGCDDRNAAERLRGMDVQIPLQEAMPLGPEEYYEHQIVGLTVWTEDDDPLGVIEEVLLTGSNAVYVTHGPRGEVLIPALKDVVLEVDLEAGRMIVRLPPGLLD
jgi:16S rRNA processing protein RimM